MNVRSSWRFEQSNHIKKGNGDPEKGDGCVQVWLSFEKGRVKRRYTMRKAQWSEQALVRTWRMKKKSRKTTSDSKANVSSNVRMIKMRKPTFPPISGYDAACRGRSPEVIRDPNERQMNSTNWSTTTNKVGKIAVYLEWLARGDIMASRKGNIYFELVRTSYFYRCRFHARSV